MLWSGFQATFGWAQGCGIDLVRILENLLVMVGRGTNG